MSQRRPENKGPGGFTVLTINGRVKLHRRRWYDPQQGTISPMDQVLGVAQRTVSLGARELVCRLNAHSSSFRKTAANLGRAAQLQTGAEQVRQLVEAEGKAVLQAQQAGQLKPTFTAEQCQTDTGRRRVYLGCDGVKVPTITHAEKKARRRKVVAKRRRHCGAKPRLAPAKTGSDQSYKEFKIVTFYDETHEHCQASITRQNHRGAQWLMSRDARRIRLDKADEKVANVDGADWIRHRIEDAKLNLDEIGLDFYHLAEHVHKARRLQFAEDDPVGYAWAADLLHTVKHTGYQACWEKLTQWRSTLRSLPKRKAMDRLMHYMAQRRTMIQYPKFLERGWQIGSGPTESLCKTTTARIKGSGMRWDADNAEAVASLAAMEQSNQWNTYWKNQLESRN